MEFKSKIGYHVFNCQILMTKSLIASCDEGEVVRRQSLSAVLVMFSVEGDLAAPVLNVSPLGAGSSTTVSSLQRRTAVLPHLQFDFPQFQLPVVNCRLRMLHGKFQK